MLILGFVVDLCTFWRVNMNQIIHVPLLIGQENLWVVLCRLIRWGIWGSFSGFLRSEATGQSGCHTWDLPALWGVTWVPKIASIWSWFYDVSRPFRCGLMWVIGRRGSGCSLGVWMYHTVHRCLWVWGVCRRFRCFSQPLKPYDPCMAYHLHWRMSGEYTIPGACVEWDEMSKQLKRVK